MENLKAILEELRPGVDFDTCENLIDGHILDSLAIISLIADIEDEFDITIPTVEIIPKNFNSAEAMWKMIQRLTEDEE